MCRFGVFWLVVLGDSRPLRAHREQERLEKVVRIVA